MPNNNQPKQLNVLCFNVNGISTKEGAYTKMFNPISTDKCSRGVSLNTTLSHYCEINEIDILMLQETKLHHSSVISSVKHCQKSAAAAAQRPPHL